MLEFLTVLSFLLVALTARLYFKNAKLNKMFRRVSVDALTACVQLQSAQKERDELKRQNQIMLDDLKIMVHSDSSIALLTPIVRKWRQFFGFGKPIQHFPLEVVEANHFTNLN